jgi:Dynein heavy chain AAA lid domain
VGQLRAQGADGGGIGGCALVAAVATGMHADVAKLDAAAKPKRVEAAFVFALTWGAGATGGGEDREKFDAFARELLSGATPQVRCAHVKQQFSFSLLQGLACMQGVGCGSLTMWLAGQHVRQRRSSAVTATWSAVR